MLVAASIHGMEQKEVNLELQEELYKAATNGKGKPQDIPFLIEAGADVNYADQHGRTPLWHSAAYGYDNCARILIGARADVNHQSAAGMTALWTAANLAQLSCVRVLIEARANVHLADWRGDTALMTAAGGTNIECVCALINARANVNHANRKGNTPLTLAASEAASDEAASDEASSVARQKSQAICELFVERLLREEQLHKTIVLHRCLWLRPDVSRDMRTAICKRFLPMRIPFIQTAGAQAVAALPEGPVKTALLKKYGGF